MQFLAMAKGSCGEVRAHLRCLGPRLLCLAEFDAISNGYWVGQLLAGFMKYLRQSDFRGISIVS